MRNQEGSIKTASEENESWNPESSSEEYRASSTEGSQEDSVQLVSNIHHPLKKTTFEQQVFYYFIN